ncbi:MAG: adenosylcobalamin-dependent ribonucleoside-diphosphate reductase [Salinibacter sp.]|uniref:adenosylcobalamin-dependent ribonucleoside-diphosphate reductase n=1 Tax=Salinibacter sp. TaxID=2065818 RepID=UPI002FC3D6FA
MTALSPAAQTVLRRRYLQQDENGTVAETPDEMLRRVASHLAQAESHFGGDVDRAEQAFYETMHALEFLPNSPTLMNAGTALGQLAACFVLPIEDSLVSIFDTLKQTALIHQSGGGTGFSFSALRPQGDVVQETGGVASGPVSFMKIYDAATEQIKQGGRRRGANMGVLDVTHTDIETFITAKREAEVLRNFNISVGTTSGFWETYEQGTTYPLVNPRTGEVVDHEDPERILDLVAEMAWATGDPGLLFLDTINAANPTPELGHITATNPCGEVPLLPHEACILGSVNLARHTDGRRVDWEKLRSTVQCGVRLLDNAIERSTFPAPEIETIVSRNRKIGLGVMGFHDLLVDLRIPYDSDAAVEVADDLMAFIHEAAWETSRQLADERGPFSNWDASTHAAPVRNATTTSIAPTGTISMIAGCSASIEPIYTVAYTKQVMGGLEMTNDRFVEMAKDRGFYSEALLDELHGRTSIQDVAAIPDDVKQLFQTAHDVPAEQHLQVQAAFQRHVDNAVSKTVNLPESASVDDVRTLFRRARQLGAKGITVFRSGARPEQVLGEDPLKEECVSECEYVAEPGQ